MGNFNGYFQRELKTFFADNSSSEDLNYTFIDYVSSDKPDRFSHSERYERYRIRPESTKPIWAVAIAEENGLLAGATADHKVHIWDMNDFELKVSMSAHTDQVWEVKFATNETTLASASSDLTIRLWDTLNGSPLGVLRGHKAPIRSLSFSFSGFLMSGDMDGKLMLWEPENAAPVKEWKAHEGSVHMVAFSWAADHHKKELPMAISVGSDGSVANWFIDRYEEEITLGGRFPGGDGGAVLCIAAHPKDSGIAAVGNQDGSVWLWSFDESNRTGEAKVEGYTKMAGHVQAVWYVEFDRSACFLASGSSDGTVRVWDVSNVHAPFLTSVFRASETWVKQVRFFGTLRALVTCSTDGNVKIWRAPGRMRKKTEAETRLKPWQQLENKLEALTGWDWGTEDEQEKEGKENERLAIQDKAQAAAPAIEDSTVGRQPAVEDGQPRSETTLVLQSTGPSVLEASERPAPPQPPDVVQPGQPDPEDQRTVKHPTVQPPRPPESAPKRGTPGLKEKLGGATPKPPTLTSTLT